MAAHSEGGRAEEVKTQFITREGSYQLLPLSEYCRPKGTAYGSQATGPVNVSFVTVRDAEPNHASERICFSAGKELYFYVYKGIRKAADLTRPIDKRLYKGTVPTCHDVNELTASTLTCALLIGFSAGQVQLVDPVGREPSKLFNEERTIDKTKVTCIKWVPASKSYFLVAHASGSLYHYSVELGCYGGGVAGAVPPAFQAVRSGEGYTVQACRGSSGGSVKSTQTGFSPRVNPLYKWTVGEGAVNEFRFSPCARYLAVVGQDGYMRVFDYSTMSLVGQMRSYFGGLHCVAWSPDGKYIATGGEDDLVTVYCFEARRVVCRGRGHQSWVACVSFDPFVYGNTSTAAAHRDENCDVQMVENGREPSVNSHNDRTQSPHCQRDSTGRASFGVGANGTGVSTAEMACLGPRGDEPEVSPTGEDGVRVPVNISRTQSSTDGMLAAAVSRAIPYSGTEPGTTSGDSAGLRHSLRSSNSSSHSSVHVTSSSVGTTLPPAKTQVDDCRRTEHCSSRLSPGSEQQTLTQHSCSEEERRRGPSARHSPPTRRRSSNASSRFSVHVGGDCSAASSGREAGCSRAAYRLGSVGQDTLLCLWDLTEDALRVRSRSAGRTDGSRGEVSGEDGSGTSFPSCASVSGKMASSNVVHPTEIAAEKTAGAASTAEILSNNHVQRSQLPVLHHNHQHSIQSTHSAPGGLLSLRLGANKYATLPSETRMKQSIGNSQLSPRGGSSKKEHKRNLSLLGGRTGHDRHSNKGSLRGSLGIAGAAASAATLCPLGSTACPRLADVPLIEPHACKKVANEMLSCVHFLRECVVTASHDGIISTWARPGQTSAATATLSNHSNCREAPSAASSLGALCNGDSVGATSL